MSEKPFDAHISHASKRRDKNHTRTKLVQRTSVGLKKTANEKSRDDRNKSKNRSVKNSSRDAPEQNKKSAVKKMKEQKKQLKKKEESASSKKNASSGIFTLRNQSEKLKEKKDAKKKKPPTTDSGLRRIQVKVPPQLKERTRAYKKEVVEHDSVSTENLNQTRRHSEDGEEEEKSELSEVSPVCLHEDVSQEKTLDELGKEVLGKALHNADNAVLTLGYYVSEGVEATLDAVNANKSKFSNDTTCANLSQMKNMSDLPMASCAPMNKTTKYAPSCTPINNSHNYMPGFSPMENFDDDQDFVITNNDMIKRRNLDVDSDTGYMVTSDSYDFTSDVGDGSEDYYNEDNYIAKDDNRAVERYSNGESYDYYSYHSSGDDSNVVVLATDSDTFQ